MKIGVVYPQIELGGDPEALRQIGIATEELGFDHLLMFDHVLGASHDREPKLWGPYTEKDPFHDPLVAFAHLAALTTRIEFVTGVLILPQRQTVLVAQQAADVDLLSGERLRIGVGSGWNYVEYEALGQDFKTRGRRLSEQIPLLRRLWCEPLVTFEGEFDLIDRGCINPRPVRSIPIWIGGFSEPAFRRGGQLGDGFIFSGPFDQDAGRVTCALRGWPRVQHHLRASDRSIAEFGAEYILPRKSDVNDAVDIIRKWQDVGGTHAALRTMELGFQTAEAHIDFMAAVQAKLDV